MVNKAEIDVFLELSCFFNDPSDVGNLISGSSAFSKTSLNIWTFTVQLLNEVEFHGEQNNFPKTLWPCSLVKSLLCPLLLG